MNSLLTGISQRPWNSICVDLRRPACGQWWPRSSGNCGGTKEELFAAATGLPAGLRELFGGLAAFPLEDRVRALVGAYLQLVDSDKSRNAILALVRSAVSHDRAAVMLREFLTAKLLPVIGGLTGHADARLRASLVGAHLIGVAVLRHVLRVEPLARATPEEIIALALPAIEQYLR